jgi:hypothetical protein
VVLRDGEDGVREVARSCVERDEGVELGIEALSVAACEPELATVLLGPVLTQIDDPCLSKREHTRTVRTNP